MGYAPIYRLAAGNAEAANRWLRDRPEHETPRRYAFEIRFWTATDEADPRPNYIEHDVGDGYNVLNTGFASNADHVLDPWATLFAKLHDHDDFEVEVLAESCSLLVEDGYFTGDQLVQVTDNRDALTGGQEAIDELEARVSSET